MADYQYPIDLDWTYQEMDQVIKLWNAVEEAYENKIEREVFLNRYRAFKEVIPSKGEEKRYANQFEKDSGYSLYQVVKKAQDKTLKTIKMNGK